LQLANISGNFRKTISMKLSDKLKRQPGDFSQRGKSPYSSARSPPDGFLFSMPYNNSCCKNYGGFGLLTGL